MWASNPLPLRLPEAMAALLAPALIAPLAALLNGLLQQDELALKNLHRLSRLNGTQAPVIELHCTSPLPWRLFLLLAEHEIQLRSTYDGEIAASIHGSAGHFSRLALARSESASLISPGLTLRGDIELIQGLHHLLLSLDIDWEAQLASLLGDTMSHQLGRLLRSGQEFSHQTVKAMQQNLSEYLQEESRLLPQAEELQHFYQEVDELRLRLDRLQARLESLQPPPGLSLC
ncbi:MAG: SCP2 sterol-binding domain-containing protein [Pseudomonadales bacterium]|nr:SCP2 sterol-binding domain-containing protein [Pseudomonadales bacterium]